MYIFGEVRKVSHGDDHYDEKIIFLRKERRGAAAAEGAAAEGAAAEGAAEGPPRGRAPARPMGGRAGARPSGRVLYKESKRGRGKKKCSFAKHHDLLVFFSVFK